MSRWGQLANVALFAGVLVGVLATGCGRIYYDPLSRPDGAAYDATEAGGDDAGATGGTSGGRDGGGGAGGSVTGTGGAGGLAGAPCAPATFGAHAYAFCAQAVSFSDAAQDCSVKGMHLVRIDDAAENAWVQMTAFASASSSASPTWPWIDGNDQAVLGEWRRSDGTLFWLGGNNGSAQGGLYSNWVAGSPTSSATTTDCAILEHNGLWNDWPCAQAQPYVCEQ